MGVSPLIKACRNNDYKYVETLLQNPGININEADEDNWTALHWAISNENRPISHFLLSKANIIESINKQNKSSRSTPLHIAILQNDFDTARIILSVKGVNVDLKDSSNRTPLSIAETNKDQKEKTYGENYNNTIELLKQYQGVTNGGSRKCKRRTKRRTKRL